MIQILNLITLLMENQRKNKVSFRSQYRESPRDRAWWEDW